MKTSLVVLAAGLGSRYGGISRKQVAEVGQNKEIIADFSVYDAKQAGFTKVVYVITREMEEEFLRKVVYPIQREGMEVVIAIQDINDLPSGIQLVKNRTKPWGTAHALWSARNYVNESFMMVQADDFYGREVYNQTRTFLLGTANRLNTYCMSGYRLGNTLSNYGKVNRGVCEVRQGLITDFKETSGIERTALGISYYKGDSQYYLEEDTVVSMGDFGFKPSIFSLLGECITKSMKENPNDLEVEYPLTMILRELIKGGNIRMQVLPTESKWLGVTYKKDLPQVKRAISRLVGEGVYPTKLF